MQTFDDIFLLIILPSHHDNETQGFIKASHITLHSVFKLNHCNGLMA